MHQINSVSSLKISDSIFSQMKKSKHGLAVCHEVKYDKESKDDVILVTSKISDSYNQSSEIPLLFCDSDSHLSPVIDSIHIEFYFSDDTCKAYFISNGNKKQINKVSIIGSDIKICTAEESQEKDFEFRKRFTQTFGNRTTELMSKLKIGIVGVSGTGSPTAEMLYRLKVGTIVLVDSDKIEEKNLGRIYNSSKSDVGKFKVDVMNEAYKRYALGTTIIPIKTTTNNPKAIRALAQCDLIFGCVDTHSGRSFLDYICNYYLIPIVDIGVKLIADGKGGITDCCYSVNYIKPGFSTLLSRNVINQKTIESEDLKYSDPDEYNQRLSEKYIKGVNEDSPAVISINTMAASMGVTEFLSRIHPFRNVENNEVARISMNLMEPSLCTTESELDFEIDRYLSKKVGYGDTVPLLEMPSLSED